MIRNLDNYRCFAHRIVVCFPLSFGILGCFDKCSLQNLLLCKISKVATLEDSM